jgi:hypothetical protein
MSLAGRRGLGRHNRGAKGLVIELTRHVEDASPRHRSEIAISDEK